MKMCEVFPNFSSRPSEGSKRHAELGMCEISEFSANPHDTEQQILSFFRKRCCSLR